MGSGHWLLRPLSDGDKVVRSRHLWPLGINQSVLFVKPLLQGVMSVMTDGGSRASHPAHPSLGGREFEDARAALASAGLIKGEGDEKFGCCARDQVSQ